MLRPQIIDAEAYRTANELIQLHGEDAKVHAMQTLLEKNQLGDTQAVKEWTSILDAILELKSLTLKDRVLH